jgi:heme exporter protein D
VNWGSFENFIHMGGHSLYVWGAYGITLALMVAEPLLAARRHRAAVARGGMATDNGDPR